MKKILSFILLLFIIVSLVSCDGTSIGTSEGNTYSLDPLPLDNSTIDDGVPYIVASINHSRPTKSETTITSTTAGSDINLVSTQTYRLKKGTSGLVLRLDYTTQTPKTLELKGKKVVSDGGIEEESGTKEYKESELSSTEVLILAPISYTFDASYFKSIQTTESDGEVTFACTFNVDSVDAFLGSSDAKEYKRANVKVVIDTEERVIRSLTLELVFTGNLSSSSSDKVIIETTYSYDTQSF